MEKEISARLHLPHYLLDCELVRYLESQGSSMEVEAIQRPSVIHRFIGDLSIDSIGHSGSLEKQELAPFMVFLSFSHYNGCKLKTGTWSTRPENSPPCMCYANGSSAVLISHSCLWGTSVKLEKKWRAFPLATFTTGDSSILSPSHYSSG